MRLLVAPVFLCLAVMASSASDASDRPYAGHQVVRFELRTARDMQTLFAMNLMPWSCSVGAGTPDFVLSRDQRAIVERLGMRYRVLIDDVQDALDEDRQRNVAARAAFEEGGIAGDWTAWYTAYRTWPEVNARLDELVTMRPDITEKLTIGTTHEGRTIYGIRIASPIEHQDDRRIVLLNGCQHAREWVSVMVPMYIADQLVREASDDAMLAQLLQGVEFIIVPIVNPDGYEFSYAHSNNRMWRRNRRDNGNGTFGVDLNRNWDVDWNGPYSTSTNTNSQVYVGPAPFSEPETQAMRDLILAEDRIAAHIDFHSYSQLILHPLGYSLSPIEDYDAMSGLGLLMRDAIMGVHGKSYPVGAPGEVLYMASGLFQDWTYVARDIFGYTVELRPAGANPGFLLPPEEIIATSEETLAAVLEMAHYVIEHLTPDVPAPQCPGDVNGDGTVDGFDLLELLAAWGPCTQAACPADINADEVVDGFDLLLVLGAWGDC